MGEDDRSPNHLVRVPRVYPEVHSHVHRLVELGKRRVLYQRDRLRDRIGPRPIDLGYRAPELFPPGGHQSTTSSPIERAVPAIIRMALSRSAALRSAILISAIFLTCARVTCPTLVRLGWPLPFSTPASLSRRFGAGGVLVMNVKVLSA